MLKAIKVSIYPTEEQRTRLASQFGCARFVYNNALEYKQAVHKQTGENVSFHSLITRIPQLKTEHPWLEEAVGMESLRVKNMLKNRRLAKVIVDAA